MSTVSALWRLVRGQVRGVSHAESLQRFYAPQASEYDAWRERLLHGRSRLLNSLDMQPGDRVVDLGCGTGRNLAFIGSRLETLEYVVLVDLCPALLDQAQQRYGGLPNVQAIEADAARWRPEQPVDHVLFSYSLTMMPNWRSAIDNAYGMLRPGGKLGVVDFFVSQPCAAGGRVQHGPVARRFWRRWFGHQGVLLDPGHIDYLCGRLPEHVLHELAGPMPFVPVVRMPYYIFLGRKAT